MKVSILCSAALSSVQGFSLAPLATHKKYTSLSKLSNSKSEDDRTGMENAFASLEDLSSLDEIGTPAKSSESKLDLSKIDISPEDEMAELSPDEVKLYKDMYAEVNDDDGESIYNDLLGEMNGEKEFKSGDGFGKKKAVVDTPSNVPLDDADGIGEINLDEEQLTAVNLSQDTDEFMKKALEEALEDARVQTKSTSISDSILNDEELMKEINAVFDKANAQLLDSIQDIKKEQAEMSERNSKNRSKALEEEEARLREAEGSVARLVDKVKEETAEVEKAVQELRDAQEKLGDDPLMKAADLKKAGIVSQSALVGALLFSFRSIGELLLIVQGSGDVQAHSSAATIQGVIALACAAYLVISKK